MDAIRVEGLSKRYGKVEALGGVDLRVPEGAVFGLVGPNGAGKTTLIKALVGALRPSGGEVRVLGLDPLKERTELRQQIGYMPQFSALYEDLSARDNVEFFGAAHRVPELREKTDEVLELTELTARAKDQVYRLSGGLKRRVSLACALVHRPQMLFLDEPTAAVDPYLRHRLWETFRKLARGGTTLFVSTHLMEEAMLCDRVAILRKGQVVISDTPRRILEKGKTRVVIRRGSKEEEKVIDGSAEDLASALRSYGLAPDVTAVEVSADSLETVVLSLIGEEAR
jgi:ABC-2 type transport system ATP-binding protein